MMGLHTGEMTQIHFDNRAHQLWRTIPPEILRVNIQSESLDELDERCNTDTASRQSGYRKHSKRLGLPEETYRGLHRPRSEHASNSDLLCPWQIQLPDLDDRQHNDGNLQEQMWERCPKKEEVSLYWAGTVDTVVPEFSDGNALKRNDDSLTIVQLTSKNSSELYYSAYPCYNPSDYASEEHLDRHLDSRMSKDTPVKSQDREFGGADCYRIEPRVDPQKAKIIVRNFIVRTVKILEMEAEAELEL
jgi:hypothetical protein